MRYRAPAPITKLLLLVTCVAPLAGCKSTVTPGAPTRRFGDEIVVAGRYFRTGAPVVLWTDPGGYDAYRTERRFVDWDKASWEATTQSAGNQLNSPNRYGLRLSVLTDDEAKRVQGGGWPLELLQQKVDQFVIHYDVCGTSRQCFRVLHDMRGLSVQFMLDIDGTIYQTMDAKERAWHAGTANSRSVGIEIANMGAYGNRGAPTLREWYVTDDKGTRIAIPARFGDGGVRTPGFVGRPIRDEIVTGTVQGETYHQYDLTPEQYDSLTRLTAALCTVFPKIQCDYPKDESGNLIPHVLSPEQSVKYQGVLGHYHVTGQKQDPGPAFQWERVIGGARKLMSREAIERMEAEQGKPVQESSRPRPSRATTSPTTAPATGPV